MGKPKVRIGTSGFNYKDWLGNFYPQFTPQADFLRVYSAVFNTVEIDATFYRMPTEQLVARWHQQTPRGFLFSAKFPKTVTHEGEPEQRLSEALHFVEIMRGLKEKLGALLLQFPYSFKPDMMATLIGLVEQLPGDVRIAVELRNKSWLRFDETLELLKENNRAFCLIDHPWMPRLQTATADFAYFRFLGDRKKIDRNFSYLRDEREEDLRWWRKVVCDLGETRDVLAYFNNHYSGHSPSTAARMIDLLGAPV